jgi:hypothetical protein
MSALGGREKVGHTDGDIRNLQVMRSADDIRAVLVERVAGMSRRPGMWAPTGQAMDLEAGNLLDVLHFIDECGPNGQFDRTARYGKLGVVGPFEHVFGKTGRFAAEVASVYAEQFHLAGYLDVERNLAVDDHAALTRSARSRFEELDFRRSEIEAELGPPSFVVDDRIGCYAPPERKAGWVFFDYWTEPVAPRMNPGKGQLDGRLTTRVLCCAMSAFQRRTGRAAWS